MSGVLREEEIPKHRRRKDRKRWCKGIVGREHDYQWGEDPRDGGRFTGFPALFSLVCSIEICSLCRLQWGRRSSATESLPPSGRTCSFR